jgi:hypothetical protein
MILAIKGIKLIEMKKTYFITLLLVLMSVFAWAQEAAPRTDVRQGAQRARIHEGRVSGELTKKEASALNSQQRHIRRTERRAERDGSVTRREQKKIDRKQNRANRNIRRAKNNHL